MKLKAYLRMIGISKSEFSAMPVEENEKIRKEFEAYNREEAKWRENAEIEKENAYELLALGGVPFDSDGEPVGIWSDD